jgi:hypothetical protein
MPDSMNSFCFYLYFGGDEVNSTRVGGDDISGYGLFIKRQLTDQW